MSVPQANYGDGGYVPPRKVDFGWISEAWRFFSQAAGIWIVAILIYGAISTVVSLILQRIFPPYGALMSPYGGGTLPPGTRPEEILRSMSPAYFGSATVFGMIYGAFQNGSLFRMAVKQVRGETLTFGDIFGGAAYFLPMLIFNLIYGLASWVGILALCVGIFVVVGLLMPAPAMIADGESAVNAVSRSIQAMKGDWLTAALFVFVYMLLYIASAFLCGLGLFVTLPMALIISALAYRDMGGMQVLPPANPYGPGPSDTGAWPPSPSSGGFGQTPPMQ